tara:strand:- start:11763 stop:11936 length:174 start_codon:yes stop_codon:yes gene_type:complete
MVAVATVRLVKGDDVRVVNADSEDEKALKADGYALPETKVAPKKAKKEDPPKGNTFV